MYSMDIERQMPGHTQSAGSSAHHWGSCSPRNLVLSLGTPKNLIQKSVFKENFYG